VRTAQTLLVGAVLLVVGLVLGGLGPRQEARQLRVALAAAEDVECVDRAAVTRQIAGVFQGRPLDAQLPEGAAPDGDGEDAPGERVIVVGGDGGGAPDTEAEPQDPEEAVRVAKQAMELRRAQARAALAEAGATEEQLAAVDAATKAMNAELVVLAEEFVGTLEAGEEPERRAMMVFASDTLDVLITAEETLYQTFDAETVEGLDETALDPLSYVDGEVVEQLVQLRGR
jgi:hypothetical protein